MHFEFFAPSVKPSRLWRSGVFRHDLHNPHLRRATAGAAGCRHAADGVRLQLRTHEARSRAPQLYARFAHSRRAVRQPRHRPQRQARRAGRARRGRGGRAGRRRRRPRAAVIRCPAARRFAAWLSSVGFTNEMQAVVYDRNGANYCGRLWWMLKWAGHEAVAVLDGGLQGLAGRGRRGHRPRGARALPVELRTFSSHSRSFVTTDTVVRQLGPPDQNLIDARAGARYRGEVEPLDPIAGHIPGALNRPLRRVNLGPDGKFKPASQLRAEFESLLAGRDPATVVHQCGSGVRAGAQPARDAGSARGSERPRSMPAAGANGATRRGCRPGKAQNHEQHPIQHRLRARGRILASRGPRAACLGPVRCLHRPSSSMPTCMASSTPTWRSTAPPS